MDKPLALKLAPKSLKDVVGQKHLVGDDKILSNIVKSKKLFSRNETASRYRTGTDQPSGSADHG